MVKVGKYTIHYMDSMGYELGSDFLVKNQGVYGGSLYMEEKEKTPIVLNSYPFGSNLSGQFMK